MKKRILFIIDSLNCGGAEKSLISLLPLLDYDRLDVILLIFKRGGVFEKYIPSQVRVIGHELYGSGFWGRIRRMIHQVNFSYQLRYGKKRHGAETHWRAMSKVIKPLEGRYDVAIAYQQGMPTFFLATNIEADKKIAWINADVFEAGYQMDYCKQFYNQMDAIVAVSQKLLEKLSTQTPWMKDRLRCIYDIINPDVIRQLAQETVYDMIPAGGEMSIATVGRLTRPKNHLMAADAARILKEKGQNFKWYFVGEGEMRQPIEEKVSELELQDNIVMLGMKENPYPYMAKADIYVQTSTFEGFGMTIAEAKILHRPVVSTNFDVVYDQITDRENGLIADMTPESVASKILELTQNKELRSHIVSNLEKENNITSITEVGKFHALIGNE
jgi:glycosyltransferase involved in cell wall biosynthesis